MGEFLDSFVSVFYPKRCPCCGEVQRVYEPCERCREALDAVRIKGTSCLKCGESVTDCHCRGFNPLYSGVIAPFKREGAAKGGIYALKFHAQFYPSEYFGIEMAKEFKRRCPDVKVDVICRVPMTKRERDNKLCDQVAHLAKYAVRTLKVPYDAKLIRKIRETERQHKVDFKDKAANVKDAFRVKKDLKGKTVLLLDDIKTTGYTLNECAKQLRLQGAKEVFCLTALVTAFNSCKEDEDNI